MADVASSLRNWSTTLGSNAPTSATTIGSGLAPNFQQIQATLRNELATRSASVTAAATTDIGTKDEGTVLVTNAAGTIAITSFGTVSAGIKKLVTFTVSGGSLSITYNATSMILPGSANITVATGDSLLAESLGSGNWKIHHYSTQAGGTAAGVTQAALQNQTYTAFTTGGTSSAFTLTPIPAITANTTNQRFNVVLNAAPTGSPTLAVSGQSAANFKYYDSTGTKQFITSAVAPSGWRSDVIYDGTDWVMQSVLQSAATSKIQPITASVSANALTITLNPTTLDFRSSTLGSGTVTTVSNAAAISIVVPSTATLGTINAVQSRLVAIAINNAGTMELAVVNIAGGNDLTETGVISTTAIAASSNSASTIYSTTARSNVSYRVVGYVESTQATAGTWATAPSTIQGIGGQALAALSSIGYGQTWQTVTRTAGTTYYNTTGKPIMLSLVCILPNTGTLFIDVTQNGVTTRSVTLVNNNTGAQQFDAITIIPPGASYVSAGNTATTSAVELR